MTTLNARVERERTNLIALFDNTLKRNYQKMLELRKEQEIAQARAFQAAQHKGSLVPIYTPQEPKKENPALNRPKVNNNNQINKQQVIGDYQNKQAINKNVIQDNQNIQKPQNRYQNIENNTTNTHNNLNNKNTTSIYSTNYNNYINPIISPHVDVRNWLSISAKVSYIRIPLIKNMENKITVNVAGKDIIFSLKGTEELQFKQVRFENPN